MQIVLCIHRTMFLGVKTPCPPQSHACSPPSLGASSNGPEFPPASFHPSHTADPQTPPRHGNPAARNSSSITEPASPPLTTSFVQSRTPARDRARDRRVFAA